MSDYDKASAYEQRQALDNAQRQAGLYQMAQAGAILNGPSGLVKQAAPTISGILPRLASSEKHAHGILADLTELAERVTGHPGGRSGSATANAAPPASTLVSDLHSAADGISTVLGDIERLVGMLKAAHG